MAKAKTQDQDLDDLDELEKEIEADLAREFDFEGDKPEPEEVDLIGKNVRFQDEDGKTITGKVVEQIGQEEVKVETEDEVWQCEISDVEVVTRSSKKPKTPTAPKKSKAPAKPKTSARGKGKAAANDKGKGKAPAKPKTSARGKGKGKAPAKPEPTNGDHPYEMMDVRLVPVSEVKVPAIKLREWSETKKAKRIQSDIKRRGIRTPIEVDSWDSMTLVDGLTRLKGQEAAKRKTIPVVTYGDIKDQDDRLWASALANEMRTETHWTDLARMFQRLIKNGKYKVRTIAQAYGMRDEQVSRMIKALDLPKPVMEIAQTDDYPFSLYTELATAPKEVVKEVTEALTTRKPITSIDVRKLKRKAEEDKGGGKKGKKGKTSKTTKPQRSYTSRDLSVADTGERIRVRVYADSIAIKVQIPWDKKTFPKNFDLLKEVAGVFDEAFADSEVACSSWTSLRSKLSAAKAELVPDK